MKTVLLPFGAACAALVACVPSAHALIIGPGTSTYSSFADSPFASVTFSSFYFQDFESHALGAVTTFNPGGPTVASIGSGSSVIDKTTSGLVDSVDDDDGVHNGSGSNGASLFRTPGSTGITFTFSGVLPTHAGIVWTDGGGTISFEAFDSAGVSLGTSTGTHATAGNNGQTVEDRFYGAIELGGISKFRISNSSGGIEVDHLQFGVVGSSGSVPDGGSSLILSGGGLLSLLALFRRNTASRGGA